MINRVLKLKSLVTVLILVTVSLQVWPQVVVERSKNKVIISGISYYLHEVRKGETVYSISKAYGITVEQLSKENPYALSGLKEGQNLRIPVATCQYRSFISGVSAAGSHPG